LFTVGKDQQELVEIEFFFLVRAGKSWQKLVMWIYQQKEQLAHFK